MIDEKLFKLYTWYCDATIGNGKQIPQTPYVGNEVCGNRIIVFKTFFMRCAPARSLSLLLVTAVFRQVKLIHAAVVGGQFIVY